MHISHQFLSSENGQTERILVVLHILLLNGETPQATPSVEYSADLAVFRSVYFGLRSKTYIRLRKHSAIIGEKVNSDFQETICGFELLRFVGEKNIDHALGRTADSTRSLQYYGRVPNPTPSPTQSSLNKARLNV